MPAGLREGSRCAPSRTGPPWDDPAPPRSLGCQPLRLGTLLSVEGVLPAPWLCCDTDSRSWWHRGWRLQACCLHRLALLNAWSPGTPYPVGQDLENTPDAAQETLRAGYPQLAKATPMSPRPEHRRQQAIDPYRADDTGEDIGRQLVCSTSGLSTWRERYDAPNLAWGQARSTRPQHSPPQPPAHVARAIVSLPVP